MTESDDLVAIAQFFILPIEEQDELLGEKFDPVWIRAAYFD